MSKIENRYEFVALIECRNGNPNGDPDADNMPRIDDESGEGFITDACIKRKIRNYVSLVRSGAKGYEIYVSAGRPLNKSHEEAYEECGMGDIMAKVNAEAKDKDKPYKPNWEETEKLSTALCRRFYDVRTFGAVASTGRFPCGVIRGAVQIMFARSVDAIMPQEVVVYRCAVANEKDEEKKQTFGRKWRVPYGLYVVRGSISAKVAQVNGFSEEDLELFWEAVLNMFEHERSASRGEMSTRKLIVFKHASELGEAPAHRLWESVKVFRKNDSLSPRSYADYTVEIDRSQIPEGVEVIERE